MAELKEGRLLQEQTKEKSEELLTEIRKPDSEIVMPAEVKQWMKMRREEVAQPTPVSRPKTQTNTGLTASSPSDPKIVVPTTRTTFGAGFKKAITDAGRWFSVFWFRMIKMKKGTIVFKDDDV